MNNSQQILERLNNMERKIELIKEHMVDVDKIMTEEDYKALLEYRKDKKAKKLVSHKMLKKRLGL